MTPGVGEFYNLQSKGLLEVCYTSNFRALGMVVSDKKFFLSTAMASNVLNGISFLSNEREPNNDYSCKDPAEQLRGDVV